MGTAKPVTDAEPARDRKLHSAGKGRNEIAIDIDRSGRTISEIAEGPGLSIARATQVQQATEIRKADLAARRPLPAARRSRSDFTTLPRPRPRRATNHVSTLSKEARSEKLVDEPNHSDKRALMLLAATAVDRSLKLAPPKKAGGADKVESLPENLFDTLRERHGDH
ncbi:helix-turn-helix domain-containing protein [Streptomyces sp. NBC_01281]|uniref:helix-turn-helix domain-containing protein n=1 Tax=unclassified Streptomyces TaxID=2593676 RepID=UPI0013BC982B|nr:MULTISPECIES: helix-turn-helix domain-containing protein [unclassified Streptomyces]NEB28560.1 helix-turn-helix domain-containing protein [Streptomyces sp. SID14446]WSK65695.1 helix-turn-helix domain-containing protein [Streptomyces sp. NBC_01281]